MVKKNNAYLLLSLLVMSAILVAIIFLGKSINRITVDKNLFKVADQTRINRVILNKSGEEIELNYNGLKWMVNNSVEADRQLIQVFFATLLQAEPRRPVALKLKDSIHQQIIHKGIEVKLFEGDLLVKNFRVAGNDKKTETYYEIGEETSPYVVTIPGYRVYVAAIFELGALDWRDKRIFNFNWQNFKRLTATINENDKESFAISFQDKFFGLEGNPKTDTTKLNDYLDAVSLVEAKQYLPAGESQRYDSLLNTIPYYTIEVTDIANRIYTLDLYPPKKQDDTILGKMGDGQAVLISREDFLRLDRRKSHF
jgi:hypothetical protein